MVIGLLVGLGLTIGLPSLADALDLRRKFYLTQGTFQGDQALTACAKGFHMASLWEIFDTSNLKYDTTRGFTHDDSGSGPPAAFTGWIRTGEGSNSTTTPGVGNCNAWTSAGGAGGTRVWLENVWGDAAVAVSPWRAGTQGCDTGERVWCVQH